MKTLDISLRLEKQARKPERSPLLRAAQRVAQVLSGELRSTAARVAAAEAGTDRRPADGWLAGAAATLATTAMKTTHIRQPGITALRNGHFQNASICSWRRNYMWARCAAT